MVKLPHRGKSFFISICKSVSFSLSPPFSLCHILMHQTAFVYLQLYTGPYSYLPWSFLITITKNAHYGWLLYCGSANENICCSGCCDVQKVVLGCRVRCFQPGLFVHGGEGVSTHCSGWLADWSVQLHSHSESSCWLYNFPTFTCAQSKKSPAQIYTTQCGWDLVGSSAMLLPYIYALHFQALWSSDSESHINLSS